MELAKITSKGQITIPKEVRNKLKLKEGEKIAFVQKNGEYVLVNPMQIIEETQEAFEGEAKRLNLKTEEDVMNMIKTIRKEKNNQNE